MENIHWVDDVVYDQDIDAERARRVELYAQQVAKQDQYCGDVRFHNGPKSKRVFSPQLSESHPQGFRSLREAAEFAKVTVLTLKRAIRNCKRINGIEYRMMPEMEGEILQCRKVRCLTNGITYASLQACARALGVTPPAICLALKMGKGMPHACKGYMIQYEDDYSRVVPS